MNPRFFVVSAARSAKAEEMQICLVRALNARQAHQGAQDEFRKLQGVPTSVFVQTRTLYDADSKEEAEQFMCILDEVMAKQKKEAEDGS